MIVLVLKILICLIFGILSFYFRILDLNGAISAVAIGMAILLARGFEWFSLLFIFLVVGAVVTRYRHNLKKRRLLERKSRKASNVIANGIIPTFIALFSFYLNKDLSIPFVASIAVALSDTMASEIGVFSNNTYLITNMKKVSPGTNGAISLLGEIAAFIGALIISISAYFILKISIYNMLLCTFLGFFGCHIDSFLGATFQAKGKGTINSSDAILNNSDVNLISISIVALIAFVITIL
ncbi:MAG: DUF92 domain-containing protein [Thermoplasmatales archaeon]|nr:DUF92 domain-containing protein [Thermoplasmatales archaeon]